MTSSRIGRSATGTSGFGSTAVYGRRRVPSPPARITALIRSPRVPAPAAFTGHDRGGELEVPVVEGPRFDVAVQTRANQVHEAGDRTFDGVGGLEPEAIANLLER